MQNVVMIAALFLGGCAAGTLTNPSNPGANLRADGYVCEREAAQSYPVTVTQRQQVDPLATLAANIGRTRGNVNLTRCWFWMIQYCS